MKKTINYLGIEKVVYEFDLTDICKALLKYFNIQSSNDYEFDVYESYGDTPAGASLIINYSKDNQPLEPTRKTERLS